LATYLRQGRPACESRRVFICAKAPRRGFTSSVAVCTIVRRALARAGLHPPSTGAHLFRHSLATEMLRRGASLTAIGEILRHRHPDTTAIYAKVDLGALRAVAPPWPGGPA
jgi:site-specific recombinase XerD